MTITTEKIIREEVTLTPPLFFKNQHNSKTHEYTALLDSETAINLFDSDNFTSVKNCDPKYARIDDAYNNWEVCSEEEFFQALEIASQKLTLKAIYHETPAR